MMSDDYTNEFWKMDDFYFDNTLESIQRYLPEFEIIRDALGFQIWLSDAVTEIHNDNFANKRQDNCQIAIHRLFGSNIFALYSAFLILPTHLIQQARPNLRNVAESISKMYYMSFCPEHIGKILLQELISGQKNKDELLQSYDAQNIYENFDIEYSSSLLNNLDRKFHYHWFNERIYTEPKIEKLRNNYSVYSASSHGTVMNYSFIKNFSQEKLGSTFKEIANLSFYNIACELNGHEKMLKDNFPTKKTFDFLDKLRKKIYVDGKMYDLFPDHPQFASKVLYHPDGPPWDA